MGIDVPFESMIGKTFTRVEKVDSGIGDSDAIRFTVSDNEEYAMLYNADCCAECYIEDICGNLNDLIGSPIVRAEANGSEEDHNRPALGGDDDSFIWTFYRIGTVKGTVVIRWYGKSNGYYSESASFERIT
jgi:hypothetical protein